MKATKGEMGRLVKLYPSWQWWHNAQAWSSNCFQLKGVPTVITASSIMQTHLEGGSSSRHSVQPAERGRVGSFVFINVWSEYVLIFTSTIMSHPELKKRLKKIKTKPFSKVLNILWGLYFSFAPYFPQFAYLWSSQWSQVSGLLHLKSK